MIKSMLYKTITSSLHLLLKPQYTFSNSRGLYSQINYSFSFGNAKSKVEQLYTKHGFCEKFLQESSDLTNTLWQNNEFSQVLKVEQFTRERIKQKLGETSVPYTLSLYESAKCMQQISKDKQAEQTFLNLYDILQRSDWIGENPLKDACNVEIQLITLYLAQNKFSQAQHWYNKCEANRKIAQNQDIAELFKFQFYFNYAHNSRKTGDHQKAEECLRQCYQIIQKGKVEQITSSQKHSVLLAVGVMELKKHNREEGISLMQKSIEILDACQPSDQILIFHASTFFIKFGLLEEAALSLDQIKLAQQNKQNLNSIYFQTISFLVEIYTKLENYEKCQETINNLWSTYIEKGKSDHNLFLVHLMLKRAHICHLLSKKEKGLQSLTIAESQINQIKNIHKFFVYDAFKVDFDVAFDEYANKSPETKRLLAIIKIAVENLMKESNCKNNT